MLRACIAASTFAQQIPFWWMPRSASLQAHSIDSLMLTSLITLFALCVLAQVLLIAGILLRRENPARFSSAWRWIATGAVVLLFVWMTMVAERLWSVVRLTPAQPHAIAAEVTGVQFQWYFRYPGPDGTYGATKPELIDAAGGNPLGLDPSDPHSKDDIVSSVLVLPVNQQANLQLRAQDVVHGLFIPALRVMQNATPGRVSHIHLTPNRPGEYAIVCSQLCGIGHYRMHAVLRVVSAQKFDTWIAQREAAQAGR